MRSAAKRFAAFLASLLIFTASYAKDVTVNYNLEECVRQGEVRYVAQIKSDEHYFTEYWGRYADYSSHECGTACISMALSYLGIDKTPEELGDYWISSGYTEGVPFSTVFGDVPGAVGGHSFDFEKAYENYENGSASPVIIYFTARLNPYKSGNRHFVMIVDKIGENEYKAVDPAGDTKLVGIRKTDDGSLAVSVTAKDGELLSGTMTEEQLCSAQYFLPDGEKISDNTERETAGAAEETEKTEEIKNDIKTEAEEGQEITKAAEATKKAVDLPESGKEAYNKAAAQIIAAIRKCDKE